MRISKCGILKGYGCMSTPDKIEEILEKDTDRPILVELIMDSQELKKFLEWKKSIDN